MWPGGSESTCNLASGGELCSKDQRAEPESTEYASRNDKVTQCGIEIPFVYKYDRVIKLEIHVFMIILGFP